MILSKKETFTFTSILDYHQLGQVEILYPGRRVLKSLLPVGTHYHSILGMPTVRKYTFE